MQHFDKKNENTFKILTKKQLQQLRRFEMLSSRSLQIIKAP